MTVAVARARANSRPDGPPRVALRAAMEAARKNGHGQKTMRKLRAVTTARHDGHDPMGLGAAIGTLVTKRASGGSPVHGLGVAADQVRVGELFGQQLAQAVQGFRLLDGGGGEVTS